MADTDTNKSTPRDGAIAILKAEHRTLGSVMHLLQQLLEKISKRYTDPDFGLLATIVYYIDVFPERVHHPKEDEHLFKRLRSRTSHADALLDELQAHHVRSAQLINYIEQTFVHYHGGAPDGFKQFYDAVNAYAGLLWDHMEQEENRMLPLAEKYLQKSDWQAIDAAFRANNDPLGNVHMPQEFRKLKQRIFNLLPRKLKRR